MEHRDLREQVNAKHPMGSVRTTGNQASDADRGTQKAYEARVTPIQQHIRHLLEEYRRLTALARQTRPSAQDDVTRLVQLHATIRPTTQLIRSYIVEFQSADAEWDRTIAEFGIYGNRSDWAQAMLQQRTLFYHGLSLVTTPLDLLYAQLLQDVQRTLDDIQTFIQAAPAQEAQPRAAATVPQPTQVETGPLHSSGSDGTPLAAENRSVPPHSGERNSGPLNASTLGNPSSRNPNPADLHQRPGPSRRQTTFVNSAYRRSGTTGIMGVTDGNVADAIPLAWNATTDREFRPGTAQAYSVASPPSNAGRPTYSVGHLAAEAANPSVQPRPPRTVNTEHKRRMQEVLVNAMPPGRGPSNATSSSPLRVGADGRPFDSRATTTAPAPIDEAVDFGEDFARENSSSFYRNANFTRRPAQTGTSQPPLMLREIPLTPFDGDVRSYQEFRNRFLEIVEAHRNLEPRHKLQHLLQHLKGGPLRMAEGFPISDESFFDVTDLLEQRYGDKTVLQNLLTQDIIDLPSAKMTRESLQLFHDKAFRTIRKLRQLGPGSGPDPLLVQILLGKLSHAMKVKLLENRDDATLDANAVLKGVRDLLSSLNRAANTGLTLHREPSLPTTPWSNPPGNFNQQGRTRTDERHNHKNAPNNYHFYVADIKVVSCPLCKEGHSADDCTTYTTAEERIRQAVEQNLCLLCLDGDHGKWLCPRRPRLHQMRDLLFNRHDDYHEALRRNAATPSLPVRTTRPLAGRQLSEGKAGDGLGPLNSLTGVPDAISPPIGTVLYATEQPDVFRARGLRGTQKGSSTSRTTASPERTAPGQEGTSRQTPSSEERSQNPQGAIAYGDEESLLTPRQNLSADNDSRTRTTQGASSDGLGTGAAMACIRAPLGGGFLRSKEEVLIHRSSEATTSRVSKPPASTSNRFTDVGYTAQPTPSSPQAVLFECVEAIASAPDEGDTTRQMRLMRPDDVLTFERSSGLSRNVAVFFDSGCSRTCVSRRLMESLQLPQRRQHTLHVNSFGTRPPAAVEGTDTTIMLWTTDYRPITFDALALATTAPHVTSALVEEAELPLLRAGLLPIRPTCLQPDIVIGHDLVHLFDREVLSRLPHGFYVVKTNIGMTIGGAGLLKPATLSGPLRLFPPGPPPHSGGSEPKSQEIPRPPREESPPSSTPRPCDNERTPPMPGTSKRSAQRKRSKPKRNSKQPAENRTEPPSLRPLHSSGLVPIGPFMLQNTEALTETYEGDCSFSRQAEVFQEGTPSEEATVAQHTLLLRHHLLAAGSKNPLDTTEPLLPATTSATEASPTSSAATAEVRSRDDLQKQTRKQSVNDVSPVQRTQKSRKTQLKCPPVNSDAVLGNHH